MRQFDIVDVAHQNIPKGTDIHLFQRRGGFGGRSDKSEVGFSADDVFDRLHGGNVGNPQPYLGMPIVEGAQLFQQKTVKGGFGGADIDAAALKRNLAAQLFFPP